MKKILIALPVLTLLCGVIMVSCSKSNEVELSQGNNGGSVCDTVNMTFTANVVPILRANCYSCHGNGNVNAGVTLDSYAGVSTQVQNGNLLAAITHTGNVTPMPYQLPKLSECDINKIKDWINRGALNN